MQTRELDYMVSRVFDKIYTISIYKVKYGVVAENLASAHAQFGKANLPGVVNVVQQIIPVNGLEPGKKQYYMPLLQNRHLVFTRTKDRKWTPYRGQGY